MAKKKEKREITLSNYLVEEEVRGLKILIAAYTIFILCAIGGFIGGKIVGFFIMEDWQFGIMVAGNVFSSIYTALTIYWKKQVFLAKYVLFLIMAIVITLGMFWTSSLWIALGYYLLTVMAGFFYSWRVSLFTGSICSVFFAALTFFTLRFSSAEAIIWLVYFIPVIAVTTFANSRNFILIKNIVEKHLEAEEAKAVLEIKINARTRELKALSQGLEKQVGERTRELQENIDEMKRFNKLAVGRELKMVALKNEIAQLKKESGKTKN